jgi:hypothetical protein
MRILGFFLDMEMLALAKVILLICKLAQGLLSRKKIL